MNYLSQPYFYVIKDKRNSKLYAGSKFSKSDSIPSNFMTEDGYQTSSTTIQNIIKENSIDTFEVLKLKVMDKPYEYETRFLKKVDAKNNPRFYNAHNNDGTPAYGTDAFKQNMLNKYGVENANYIPEAKEKSLQSYKATTSDPVWKETVGKQQTAKRLLKMDYVACGKKQSQTKSDQSWKETKGKESIRKFKETRSDPLWKETVGKQQIEKRLSSIDYVACGKAVSKTRNDPVWKAANSKTCEYCGRGPFLYMNYNRWHGENCKEKGT